MRPTQNYVYVIQVERDQKTPGGLILTADIETGSKPAFIKATGPDVTTCKTGDKVYVKWSDGVPVTHMGEMAVLLPDTSVLAVFE